MLTCSVKMTVNCELNCEQLSTNQTEHVVIVSKLLAVILTNVSRVVYGSSGGTFVFRNLFFLYGRNNKNPDLALFRPNQLIFMAPQRRMKQPGD